MLGKPVVQPLEQLASAIAILQRKIDGRALPVFRSEHVDLALATALQRNGIEIATGGGFDIQRNQLERRAIVRRRFELRIDRRTVTARCIRKGHRRGDETLHQVALGGTDIGLIDVHPGLTQQPRAIQQATVRTAVQPHHWPMAEVAQGQRSQLHIALAT